MAAKIKTARRSSAHRHSPKPRGVSDHSFKKVYWPYIPVVLIVGILLTFSSQSGAIASFVKHPSGRVLAYATSMSINGLLSDTNAARSKNGVVGLTLNSKLDAAAQAKANDMASRNYWSHNTPEGNPPWTFVEAQNYAYQKLGENLAAGFTDEQSTIDGWMASAPHRENLLDSAFSQVGFGFANNANYTSAGGGPMTIVVAFYGKPQVQAAKTSAPISNTSAPSSTTNVVPSKKRSAAVSKSKSNKEVKKTTAAKKQPVTTLSDTALAGNLAAKSSHAQVVLAGSIFAKFGTSLALIGALGAIAIWASRHALSIRRTLIRSEKFAIRHPLFDLGLLVIAALSFLLSQTAGLIQ